MARKSYKIVRTINGEEAGTLYNFPYKRDAQKRLQAIKNASRYPIFDSSRDSFAANKYGDIYRFSIITQ